MSALTLYERLLCCLDIFSDKPDALALKPDHMATSDYLVLQPPNVSGQRVQDPTRRPTSFEVLQALLEMEAQVNRGNPRAHGERATLADTRTGNASWVQRSISKIANALHRRLSI